MVIISNLIIEFKVSDSYNTLLFFSFLSLKSIHFTQTDSESKKPKLMKAEYDDE